MKIFIDESGAFNWSNAGLSVFCGVSIADRILPEVYERFISWRKSIIGNSSRELKGSELTDPQLYTFVRKVLPSSNRDVHVTVVGVDTLHIAELNVVKLQRQASQMYHRSSELVNERGNRRVAETYRQMAGWVTNRSTQNILWIVGLEEAVIQSLQHSIVRFMEPEDDAEFNDVRIAIDQSFIRRDEHAIFWREWLRNGLSKKSRGEGTIIPDTWRQRDHPFMKEYEMYPGLLNFQPLFQRKTGFFNSKNVRGLQIADICAHLIYRHHRNEQDHPAYVLLRPRIVGRDGREMTVIDIDERSLHKDDPKNHVAFFDLEEMKRRADERTGGSHLD
jgi:hypothetical protein